jgi:hypothetical protein
MEYGKKETPLDEKRRVKEICLVGHAEKHTNPFPSIGRYPIKHGTRHTHKVNKII